MSRQHWNPAEYASNARFVSDLGQPAIDLLDARAGERVLDLGCGDGALTEQLASLGVSVVGIDSSAEMVAAARARGLDARVMDANRLTFEGDFDAVFSNAVLHWVPDLGPVLAGVHRALKPGGRFAGECGGHGCVAAVCTALRAVAHRRRVAVTLPWRFRGIEELEAELVAAGFQPTDVRLISRPTPLPAGMAGWLRTFAAWAFDALPATEREAAFTETIELLRPALCDHRGPRDACSPAAPYRDYPVHCACQEAGAFSAYWSGNCRERTSSGYRSWSFPLHPELTCVVSVTERPVVIRRQFHSGRAQHN